MIKKLFSETLVKTYRAARRLVIAVVGTTVVLIGLILIFAPGPALVVIPCGLAILSIEFAWARRLLRRMRNSAGGAWDKMKAVAGKDERKDDQPETVNKRSNDEC